MVESYHGNDCIDSNIWIYATWIKHDYIDGGMVVDDGVVRVPCPVLSAMYGDRDRITAASSIFRMQSTLFWTPSHLRSHQSVPTESRMSHPGWCKNEKSPRIDIYGLAINGDALLKIQGKPILAVVAAAAEFEPPVCPVMTGCWLGVLNQFWLDQRPDALRTIQGAQISPGLHTSLTSPICYLRHKIGVKFRAVGENSSKTWMF